MARKQIGYLFAMEHGAKLIYDYDMEIELIGDIPSMVADRFIEVTYVTGDVWNPYPFMVNRTDIWPRGVPRRKDKIQQQFLNEKREKIPISR